jgi:exopolyphosphatase / guanosine-5'-triphosphate,3'-diphosphate pyrophosphatase
VFGAVSCWQVIGMTRKQRAAPGPMGEVRVDVIGAGGIIVEQLAQVLHNRASIDELIVSEHDILDRIALSVAG